MRHSFNDRNSRFFNSQCVLVSVQYDKSPYKERDDAYLPSWLTSYFLHQRLRFLLILLYGIKKLNEVTERFVRFEYLHYCINVIFVVIMSTSKENSIRRLDILGLEIALLIEYDFRGLSLK